MNWVTNSSQAAKRLRRADKAYDTACAKAVGLPLAEKIVALRNAKLARQEAYTAIGDANSTETQ